MPHPPGSSPRPGRPFTFGSPGAWGFHTQAPSPTAAMGSLPPAPMAPPFADAAAERTAAMRATAERIAAKGSAAECTAAVRAGPEHTAAGRAVAERKAAGRRAAGRARITLAINVLERRVATVEAAAAAASLSAALTGDAVGFSGSYSLTSAYMPVGRISPFREDVAAGCAHGRTRSVALPGNRPMRGRRRPHLRMRARRESFLIRCPSSALLQRRWRRDVGCA